MIPTRLMTPVLSATEVKKSTFTTKLNLVALMDIFTILVFFLLLNSGDADRLQNAKFVTLPSSSEATSPHVEAMIVIDAEEVWLNDELVVNVEDITEPSGQGINLLGEALKDFSDKRPGLNSYEKENGLPVTIMGDKAVPFSLLERVMKTCRTENYRDISLAVNRVVTKQIAFDASLASVPSTLGRLGGE